MKKVFALLALLTVLVSCEQVIDPIIGKDVFDHVREPSISFSSLDEANTWLIYNVRYKNKNSLDWQPPETTIRRKTGNCADYCIFMMWYADKMGYDVYMKGVRLTDGGKHAILVINGRDYEPQAVYPFFLIMPYTEVIGKWSLEEALDIAYYECGNRSIEGIDIFN